jgi:hypothetical protein
LSQRTLKLSASIPGFEYRYFVCTNQKLGICWKHEQKVETYDLRDEVVRKQLIDMGFSARVQEKP